MRKIDLFTGAQCISRVDGLLQDRSFGSFVNVEWESGQRLSFSAATGFTRVDESFDLSDRVPVPPGDYNLSFFAFDAGTSTKRAIAAGGGGQFFRIYGGQVQSFGGSVVVAGGSHLALKLEATRNHADLPNGSFTGDIWSVRLGWAFSTRLTASAFVQYDSLEQTLLTNLRLSFIHRPGSDLFPVVNEERATDRAGTQVVNRAVAIKLTWLVRF